jgi:hypothetical protein
MLHQRRVPLFVDSFFLPGFRARVFPDVPALPVSLLDGKEGVDGSSPAEGFGEVPASAGFACPRLIEFESVRGL